MVNPRFCIYYKDLNNLQTHPTHFYEYIYKATTSFCPNMAHNQVITVQEIE